MRTIPCTIKTEKEETEQQQEEEEEKEENMYTTHHKIRTANATALLRKSHKIGIVNVLRMHTRRTVYTTHRITVKMKSLEKELLPFDA